MAWKQAHKLLSIRDLSDCMKYSREVVTVRVALKKKKRHASNGQFSPNSTAVTTAASLGTQSKPQGHEC